MRPATGDQHDADDVVEVRAGEYNYPLVTYYCNIAVNAKIRKYLHIIIYFKFIDESKFSLISTEATVTIFKFIQ